jgi:hypothetical protein
MLAYGPTLIGGQSTHQLDISGNASNLSVHECADVLHSI